MRTNFKATLTLSPRLKSVAFSAILVSSLSLSQAHAFTTITISTTTVVLNAKRMGVNLGGHNFYDSSQYLKNPINANPGFEPQLYQSIIGCASGGGDTCTDTQMYDTWPNHFWQNGTYRVLTGQSKGRTGTIIDSNTSYPYSKTTFQFSTGSPAIGIGDYIAVEQQTSGVPIPATVNQGASPVNGWFTDTSGGGTFSADAIAADQAPGTAGVQCLKMDASGGKSLGLSSPFDTTPGHLFYKLNGSYQLTFKAKLLSGSSNLQVNLARNATYLNQNVVLSSDWQTYTLPFTANEDNSTTGTVWLNFKISDTAMLIDDVSLNPVGGDGTNPTIYTDAMVNTLRTLNPGIIRNWELQLGDSLDNLLAPSFGRMPSGYSVNYNGGVAQEGIQDFLQLCETVGAEPWYVMPINWGPTDIQNFMEYLGGSASTPYGAKRAALGHPVPWTTTFSQIHLELGNENWDSVFSGGIFGQIDFGGDFVTYAQQSSAVYGAAKASPYYQAGKFDFVMGGQAVDSWGTGLEANASTQNDSFGSAPYVGTYATDGTDDQLFGPLFAETQWWTQPTGYQGLNAAALKSSSHPVPISDYEENVGAASGLSQSSLNMFVSSLGSGLALGNLMLMQLRDLGIVNQSIFALTQFNFSQNNLAYPLWGIVYDMGITDRKRPQFLAEQLINQAIGTGANVLQTSTSGDDPTWSSTFTPDGSTMISVPNAHEIESFAFSNGSVIVMNLSRTTARDITFSGLAAPSGSLLVSQLTSSSLRNTNENSTLVAITSSTVTSFNPAVPYTLPPYSMTLFTPTSTTGTVAPVITTQPQNTTVSAGQSVSFTVAATGTPSPTFQWQSLVDGVWTDETGATQSTFTLTNVQVSQSSSAYHVLVSNSSGTVTSATAFLTVSSTTTLPTILGQPQSVSALAGSNASFSVSAIGIPDPSFQWQSLVGGVWTDLAGATLSTFTLTNVQVSQSSSAYQVLVFNSSGSVTSNTAYLTVLSTASAPVIVTQPQSVSVLAGASASFSVNATGNPDPSYQWQSLIGGVWNDVVGATQSTFTLTDVQVSQSSSAYQVIVFNSSGSVTSNTAYLTVLSTATAPVILAQPQSVSVLAGASASFSVNATGNPDPSYQWQSLIGGVWNDVVGATQSTFTLTNVQVSQSSSAYHVIVSNSAGMVTSATAFLTVTSTTTAPVMTAPVITSEPQNTSVAAGQPAIFTVTAVGVPDPSYQWQYLSNGVWTDYGGSTQSTFTLTNVQLNQNGTNIRVVVSNAAGTVTSSAVILTVTSNGGAPLITVPPQSTTVSSGQSAVFNVTATGSPTLLYQWQYLSNGEWTDYGGSTQSTFTLTNVQMNQNGTNIRVVVSNALGRVASDTVILTVSSTSGSPVITTPPQSTSVLAGQAATFSVTATGSPTLTYQWQYEAGSWVDYGGSTQPTFTLSNVQANQDGTRIRVVVSNNFGSVASDPAILSVASSSSPVTLDASPAGETFSESLLVALQTDVPNALIYYTMDGTAPDSNSLFYTSPITLNQTTTLRAVAYVFGQPVATVVSQYTRTSGSAAAQLNTNLDHVIVYPNPWRSDQYTVHKITFGNLPAGSTVKVFTLSGHEVKEFSTDGNSAVWDLTTDSGSMAASGVYFYLVQDLNGEKVRGKLAIIR